MGAGVDMPEERKMIMIQAATVADAAEILALQKEAWQSEALLYDDFSLPPLTQSLDELQAEFRRRVILKAQNGEGRIIGFVQGFEIRKTCFIGRLTVHPEYRRKGIGTRLMAAIEASFPKADRFELFTGHKSRGNIRLYMRLGYTPFRTEEINPELSMIFMEKWLSL